MLSLLPASTSNESKAMSCSACHNDMGNMEVKLLISLIRGSCVLVQNTARTNQKQSAGVWPKVAFDLKLQFSNLPCHKSAKGHVSPATCQPLQCRSSKASPCASHQNGRIHRVLLHRTPTFCITGPAGTTSPFRSSLQRPHTWGLQ